MITECCLSNFLNHPTPLCKVVMWLRTIQANIGYYIESVCIIIHTLCHVILNTENNDTKWRYIGMYLDLYLTILGHQHSYQKLSHFHIFDIIIFRISDYRRISLNKQQNNISSTKWLFSLTSSGLYWSNQWSRYVYGVFICRSTLGAWQTMTSESMTIQCITTGYVSGSTSK